MPAEGDETRGPIAFDHLIELLSQLPTPSGVLVWRDGLAEWTAAENVREIVEKLIRPPPLRPASAPPTVTTLDTADTVARYQQQFKKDEPVDDGTVARYQQQFQKGKPDLALQSELTGIGGWLALLGFGLVTGMLRALVKTGEAWSSVDANAFSPILPPSLLRRINPGFGVAVAVCMHGCDVFWPLSQISFHFYWPPDQHQYSCRS